MRFFLLILIISSFSNIISSQENIEELVLKKVNHLRDSLDLPSLSTDNVLFEAGKDHAYYMSQKKELSHFQNTFSKETPSARVEYYQGNRTYIGENVAIVKANELKSGELDIKRIAKNLFNSWLHSPPHFKNMITPEYSKMGIGYFTSSSKQLYAAQVFSSNEIKLPTSFQNVDFSWGVRPTEYTCKHEAQTYETMFFANSVEVKDNEVYFNFHDLNFFKKVIKNDNDGLAIDVVIREQLPCNKENQFHISLVHDGEMQRPIYKNDIYRNNISNNPKKIKIKIGDIPPYLRNSQWEANIIIINDNKLCDYSFPVEVPSDIFPLLNIKPYYETNDSIDSLLPPLIVSLFDSMHVELLYERSKNYFFSLNRLEFERMMRWGSFVKGVNVDCYASVEGASWFNNQLLESRKNSVTDLLVRSGFNLEKIKINTSENWPRMNSQIENNSLDIIRNKTKGEIKRYFKKNKSEFNDSLLFEQRKTHVRAIIDTTLLVNHYNQFRFAQYYDSTISMSCLPWNRILREDYIFLDRSLDIMLIDSLQIQKELKTNLLGASSINNVNQYIDSVLMIKLLSNIDHNNSKQLFNFAHLLTKYWFTNYSRSYKTKGVAVTISPNELLAIISKIDTCIIEQNDLNRLQVNVLLSGIHYYVAYNNWEPVDTYFKAIATLVKTNGFSAQEATELALFCNHFHKFNIAVDIMHPFHQKKLLSENGQFILAKTSTLIRGSLEPNVYHAYMEAAKKLNLKRYCNWLDNAFQIQRDEFIKKDFCKEC